MDGSLPGAPLMDSSLPSKRFVFNKNCVAIIKDKHSFVFCFHCAVPQLFQASTTSRPMSTLTSRKTF